MSEVRTEVRGGVGFVTLDRPKALNALSLAMIRELASTLRAWRDDPAIGAVAVRGMGREGPFGVFCAGGDIRFFHRAALAGQPALEDFFTEEYALDHLVHHYPKPYVVFMDGITMGGGMGLSAHGGAHSLRIATPRSRLAMPETQIGLFPDVGGGWVLARCPGHLGEYLALTGQGLDADDALAATLADGVLPVDALEAAWQQLGAGDPARRLLDLRGQLKTQPRPDAAPVARREAIDACFGAPTVSAILRALEADGSPWARETVAALRQRSPLMLHVTLRQVRLARAMGFAEELRMERGMMRHCFHWRPGAASETVEGIRALAVDKDHAPRWNPATIEAVRPEEVDAFFVSPWPPYVHPLRDLVD